MRLGWIFGVGGALTFLGFALTALPGPGVFLVGVGLTVLLIGAVVSADRTMASRSGRSPDAQTPSAVPRCRRAVLGGACGVALVRLPDLARPQQRRPMQWNRVRLRTQSQGLDGARGGALLPRLCGGGAAGDGSRRWDEGFASAVALTRNGHSAALHLLVARNDLYARRGSSAVPSHMPRASNNVRAGSRP
jgi:hypothetical protein